jgi:hypothetical protein
MAYPAVVLPSKGFFRGTGAGSREFGGYTIPFRVCVRLPHLTYHASPRLLPLVTLVEAPVSQLASNGSPLQQGLLDISHGGVSVRHWAC